jgi:hypothetical protein
MADLNVLICLRILKLENNDSELHPDVINDQLDGLLSRREVASIRNWDIPLPFTSIAVVPLHNTHES